MKTEKRIKDRISLLTKLIEEKEEQMIGKTGQDFIHLLSLKSTQESIKESLEWVLE